MARSGTPAVAPSQHSLGLALAWLWLAGGCATLSPPDHQQIQAQALGGAQPPAQWASVAATGEVSDAWIASFGDRRLDALVAEAIAHNTDLRIAATRVQQADAAVDVAQGQLYPAIGVLARASSKPIDDLVAVVSGAVLKVWWEIDLWGRLRYARNAAVASRDASSADYRFARQSIAAATARAWFLVAETAQQREIAMAMADSGQQLVTLSQQRWKVGAGSEQDVTLARANLALYQDSVQQIDLAHRQASRALEVLLGRFPRAELEAGALPTMPDPVPAGIPAQVLERRPDLIAAEHRVAAAFNRVGEAKAARLPGLTLGANAGRIADDLNGLENGRDRSIESAGGSLVAPIFLGGTLSAQVQLRNAEQEQALADYARLALQAVQEVEDALDAEQVLAERERILRAALVDNQRTLELQQSAFGVGKIDMRAVAQSGLAVYAAQVVLLQVQRERLSRRVGLHLALGGDFDLATTAPIATADVSATR
ncbi:efflux transporter outer membrane subunit [Pseudoxanthomonas dokdonensis]|uniref:Transporter n=1 Tax=Pseudoxanthomonas dokdonensis TaxID=344882 RepID=A0A0R0CN92_9GAMM|nr:efflux transporter outer membrane subunit [Pseudoxanthomonas dokdonensis]KRG71485.1 hypothetical protein ABB29_01535 [Pseudoxanthomonas dokdonensis]